MLDDAVIDQAIDTVSPETADLSSVSAETHEPAPERTSPTRKEQIDGLVGKDLEQYRLTGKLPSERTATTTTPGASEEAQNEPDSGPGEIEQPPKPPTRQDRNFRNVTQEKARLERELIAANAKLELYERERAGSRPSAPAAPAEKPMAQASDPAPEFPDIDKYETTKDFNAAVKQWQAQNVDWTKRQINQGFQGERARQTQEQSTQQWNAQVEEGRKLYPKDFEAVAFGNHPLSYSTMAAIHNLPDGALRSYALGKNPDLATKIAELTAIPGEAQFQGKDGFARFMQWVRSSPERAMIYGEKLALAKAELAKLTVGKTQAAPVPQRPLKEIIARQSRPSAEVDTEGSAAPVLDPIKQALKNKDNVTYRKLKNAEEIRERLHR